MIIYNIFCIWVDFNIIYTLVNQKSPSTTQSADKDDDDDEDEDDDEEAMDMEAFEESGMLDEEDSVRKLLTIFLFII